MAQLKYKSMIPNDKPIWLLRLQQAIENEYNMQDTFPDFDRIKTSVDYNIAGLIELGDIVRSNVTSEIRTDEGKAVLFIKRNGKVLQTYYFE